MVSPMSSDDIAIRVTNLCKSYQIYETPRDRLKQFILPRLQRIHNRKFCPFLALARFEAMRGNNHKFRHASSPPIWVRLHKPVAKK